MRLIFAAFFSLFALVAAPLSAQIAAPTAANAGDPAARPFIEKLTTDAFAILRDKSLSKAESRARFRTMLQANVALADIGDRLITRLRREGKVSPAQYQAWQAALPDFILNAYASRLYDYDKATVKVIRTVGRGPFTEVYTRVTRPGEQPVDAIWQVKQGAKGAPVVNNLIVSGVNLTLTQEADFYSYAQKNGVDALIAFVKNSNGVKTSNERKPA
jgi:phospholipid transport system substrate-binding protein